MQQEFGRELWHDMACKKKNERAKRMSSYPHQKQTADTQNESQKSNNKMYERQRGDRQLEVMKGRVADSPERQGADEITSRHKMSVFHRKRNRLPTVAMTSFLVHKPTILAPSWMNLTASEIFRIGPTDPFHLGIPFKPQTLLPRKGPTGLTHAHTLLRVSLSPITWQAPGINPCIGRFHELEAREKPGNSRACQRFKVRDSRFKFAVRNRSNRSSVNAAHPHPPIILPYLAFRIALFDSSPRLRCYCTKLRPFNPIGVPVATRTIDLTGLSKRRNSKGWETVRPFKDCASSLCHTVLVYRHIKDVLYLAMHLSFMDAKSLTESRLLSNSNTNFPSSVKSRALLADSTVQCYLTVQHHGWTIVTHCCPCYSQLPLKSRSIVTSWDSYAHLKFTSAAGSCCELYQSSPVRSQLNLIEDSKASLCILSSWSRSIVTSWDSYTRLKSTSAAGSCCELYQRPSSKLPILSQVLILWVAYSHRQFSSYEPKLFLGHDLPKIVLLIFVSGKIVLTGAIAIALDDDDLTLVLNHSISIGVWSIRVCCRGVLLSVYKGASLFRSKGKAAAPALSTRSKTTKQPTSKVCSASSGGVSKLAKKKSNFKKKEDEHCRREIQECARRLQEADEDPTPEDLDVVDEDELPPADDHGVDEDSEQDSDLELFNEMFGLTFSEARMHLDIHMLAQSASQKMPEPHAEWGVQRSDFDHFCISENNPTTFMRSEQNTDLVYKGVVKYCLDLDINEDVFNNGTPAPGGDENNDKPANNDPAMDMDDDDDDDGPTNAIDINSSPAPITPSKKSSKCGVTEICCHMSLAMSPSRARSSHVTSSPVAPRQYKITRSNFTPRTRRYAEAAKKGARCAATMVNAFPEDKHSFFLAVAQQQASKDVLTSAEFLATLTHLRVDLEVQKWFTIYMGYGHGGLFTALIGSARKWVAGFYNLPGWRTSAQVRTIVAWLLQEGHFKYADIDLQTVLKNLTFDKMQPFGNEGIAHILRLEIFAAKGGANIEVFRDIVSAKRIRGPTVALMCTVIEHALMEYSEGSCRFSEFSDAARPRYLFHLSSYQKVAAAITWLECFETGLFKLVLSQSNRSFLLDVEADDMGDVDLEALMANAIAEKAAEDGIQAGGQETASQPTGVPSAAIATGIPTAGIPAASSVASAAA
ncbi:hypothetical protein BT96DRAFT_1070874 [Gymnopus androsaceus JB14]|uniref:DUF6532 domain-containing protein n=1 Tax=Gymnopus androsaceus JB14 TaxID=1447944 RepID=A0A6A4GV81_9AGAR|nr:hypothetical protein BT96DRAFT_1070874 [Gymnopus androsaceus JB14]